MSEPAQPRRMSRERWLLLEPLIDAVLDLAPDRRPAFYDEVAATDPELRAELERLVERSGEDDALFSTAAAERLALLFDGTPAPSLTADVLSQLQSSLGAVYTLERELGGGGMSRVFLAHEAELGRRVVIKVLTPELAAGMNAERFDREIKLVASLQQANIVPLLSTGRAAGYPYYTMPFVEGRSLRDRLVREGVLPIGEGVNLLRDVARALAYAHGQGVVHRDIKPGNVLLSHGTAVVTDFGIAKAISAAFGGVERAEAGPGTGDGRRATENHLTNAGSGIGTPPYMAPEQAAGDPTVDHRADIYAFGCLAYEVFTGKPPFRGDTPHLIIAAHLQETPRPVTEGRSDVPPAIAALISQCLEKKPRQRPQTATELLDVLDALSSGPTPRLRRRSRVPVARGALVALAGAVGAAGYLAYRGARGDEPNAAREALTGWTSNGEAVQQYRQGEALLNRRGSGVQKSVQKFEAAITLDPNFARAHAALAKALAFYPLFYGRARGEAKDTVIHTAHRALALDSTLADAHTAIAMVYANSGKWDSAATEFQRAVAADPANFDAHFNYGRISTIRGKLPEAIGQLNRAKELDPASALALAWSSYAHFLNSQGDSALKESAAAFLLDSTLTATTHLGALVNLETGHPDSARRLIADQAQLNPMSTAPYVYAMLRDTARAMRIVRQLERAAPQPWSADVQRAHVRLAIGDSAGALSLLERSVKSAGPLWVFVISPRDPAFDPVRQSTRFAELVGEAGLDVAWVTAPRR